MSEVTIVQHVNAPRERVFAVSTDLPRAVERIDAITKLEILTDGPVGRGTRFRETRVMFGKEATEEMEITSFDPPVSYAFDAHSHGCHYHTSFRLIETEGGQTDLEMTFNARPLTFGAKIMTFLTTPMLKGMIRRECGKDLANIAAVAESDH